MKKGPQLNRLPGSTGMLLPALAMMMLGLAAPARAGAPSPLDGFDPSANGYVKALAAQADGKLLLGGEFTAIDGTARGRIARLNADGSLDAAFDPGTGANGTVSALAVQADGRIWVGGGFTTLNGIPCNRIARLNADGSLDVAFHPGAGANNNIRAVALQADGKALLGGSFTSVNGTLRSFVARLNADGSLDASFDAAGAGVNGTVAAVAVQTDGKVLLGGLFTGANNTGRYRITRLNANGSPDATFNPGTGADSDVEDLAVQPDGKILLAGAFTQINGTVRYRIARLSADGSLDATFNPGAGADKRVYALALQADGRVLLGGDFLTLGGKARAKIGRLNADGTLDTAFVPGAGANGAVFALAVQADGKVLPGGAFTAMDDEERGSIARLNADGSLERTFDPDTGPSGDVNALALQLDGKVLLGGNFTTVTATTRHNLARLNADGSLDPVFGAGQGANGAVGAMAVQPDGKVLLSGVFTRLNATARGRIARLNADGSLDATFDPGAGADNYVSVLGLQSDGKVLLGGGFTSINGTDRGRIARLNANGSLDAAFNPGTGADGPVNVLALQPDGKVLLGGYFTQINGTARGRIARLNANGSLDAAFNPGTGADYYVLALAVQPDGKVLVGGSFSSINGTPRRYLARLNANGSVDAGFDPGTGANGYVSALALQADGKVLVGGSFTGIDGTPRNHIARLNADGSLDAAFDPGAGTDNYVLAVLLQPDGKLLLGGGFTMIDGTARSHIARLSNPDAAQQVLSVETGGGSVAWTLGGSFPQPYQVLFEESADGAAWTRLGWGAAAPGAGYGLGGLRLPLKTSHYLRATGWVAAGWDSGSVSLHRSVLRFNAAMRTAVGDWGRYE